MNICKALTVCIAALAAASIADAQQQRAGAAFTTTGTNCSDVRWSQEALRQYPRIASACREVMERDGKHYVRFEGEVQRVADRGRELTIDFRDGDTLTLTPPENLSVSINGRPTAPRDLRPGDDLTFYVPQDLLAASFFAGQPETAPPQVVPIEPPREVVAQTQPPRQALPRTASVLPFTALAGFALLAVGALLRLRRHLFGT
jgi:hypothetical protein